MSGSGFSEFLSLLQTGRGFAGLLLSNWATIYPPLVLELFVSKWPNIWIQYDPKFGKYEVGHKE